MASAMPVSDLSPDVGIQSADATMALDYAPRLSGRISPILRYVLIAAAFVGILATFGSLAVYSLRIPNGVEAYLRDAAAWIAAAEAQSVARPLLLSGSSPRRVAFYADLRHQAWPENERSYEKLAEHILHFRPAYFALEDGPGQEREGNRGLVERLGADGRIGPFCPTIQRFATSRGDAVVIYAFAWPKE